MEKIKSIAKPIVNWALIAIACIASYLVGFYLPTIQQSHKTKFINAEKLTETSVAVTDRGELLIINRADGTFDVYEEKVGLEIFKAYGTHITNNQPK